MKIRKRVIATITLLVIAFLLYGMRQYFLLRKAHETFDNYYAFRGCAQLIGKTDTYGICKLKNGNVIKIIKYQNKWYLHGDLPTSFPSL